MSNLPTDAKERKDTPIYSGFVKYFPDAMAAVAQCSKAGNDQHNPGKPLHWDRSKSGDELDALQRHLIEAGTVDTDGIRHSAKVAWRAMANLQKEIEREAADAAEQEFWNDVAASTPKVELELVPLPEENGPDFGDGPEFKGFDERCGAPVVPYRGSVQEPSSVCSPNGVADDWMQPKGSRRAP